MLEYRLKAYNHFAKTPMPEWGPDLSEINFDDYTYYIKPSEKLKIVGMKFQMKSKTRLTN